MARCLLATKSSPPSGEQEINSGFSGPVLKKRMGKKEEEKKAIQSVPEFTKLPCQEFKQGLRVESQFPHSCCPGRQAVQK